MTEIDILTQTDGFSNLNYLDNGKTRVSGFAIHEGTYNDITFTKEELDKCVNDFVGKVMLKDHTAVIDNVIGEIMETECKVDPSNGLYGIAYSADIDSREEELLHKMELGFVKSTSIGIMSEKKCSICGADIFECNHWFWDEGFQILATNIKPMELSIVAVPADKNATVDLAFSDDKFLEELETLKTQRRTNMSDKFEEKYAEVMDEFSQFKIEKADEIAKLKEDFKAEKDDLEAEMADKVSESLELKNELDTLKQEKESLSEEVAQYKEMFAQMEEERLASLREELAELNEKVGAGFSEERINKLGEKALKDCIKTFSNIHENMTTRVAATPQEEQHYEEHDVDENATPIDQFMSRVKL